MTKFNKSLSEVLASIDGLNSSKKMADVIVPAKSLSEILASIDGSNSYKKMAAIPAKSLSEVLASIDGSNSSKKMADANQALSAARDAISATNNIERLSGLDVTNSTLAYLGGGSLINRTSTDNIHRVASSLAKSGQRPTLAAVREKLGGGSFTTISEAMKSWRDEHEELKQAQSVNLPADISHRLQALGVSIWEASNTLANERFSNERHALKHMQKNVMDKLAQTEEIIKMLEEENKQGGSELKQLKNRHQHTKLDLAECTMERDNLRKELAICHGRISEQASQINDLLRQQLNLTDTLAEIAGSIRKRNIEK